MVLVKACVSPPFLLAGAADGSADVDDVHHRWWRLERVLVAHDRFA
jgi:hypothetical protein